MSTRKTSEQIQPSPRLRARAVAIITSDKYDRDTREAIAYQLKTNYSELADMVRDAEKGVTICDGVALMAEHPEQFQTEPSRVRLAKAISEIVNNPATPVGLFHPVSDFLHSEGSRLWGKLITTPPMIEKILIEASVNEEVSNAAN